MLEMMRVRVVNKFMTLLAFKNNLVTFSNLLGGLCEKYFLF